MSEQKSSIYGNLASRCKGDIYIGVVGPCRTGKSTFIKKCMEELVLPGIRDAGMRERARDELPQSAGGRTVMTTEPKFIPEEAVNVLLEDGTAARVRLVDCVGYIIPDVLGTVEEGQPRMVHTPWQEEPLPFAVAAEMGTEKVIREHATLGVVVTTDGSIGDLPRSAFVEAEERVVRELRELGKPFVLVLNVADPQTPGAVSLATELETTYGVPVALVNCLELDETDIAEILRMVLMEFPVRQITLKMPGWIPALPENHPIRQTLRNDVGQTAGNVKRMGDVADGFRDLAKNEYVAAVNVTESDPGNGSAVVTLTPRPGLYYEILSSETGFPITDEEGLLTLLRELSETKVAYDRVKDALQEATETGYGIVLPALSDLELDEPHIARQAGGWGVHLRARAGAIHMIRTTVETEINPVVGTEQQSEDLVAYMTREFEGSPDTVWQANLFGRTLYDLVGEGLHAKLAHMAPDAKARLAETLERIINEGSDGLICILL